jgi:uncharacterized protein YecE (DUF72 family)
MTGFRIGTAAWALPRDVRDRFPEGASNLHRYAGLFSVAEINSSFYRPHRPATYRRWADSVPEGFRFSVKLPKAITHEARLIDCEPLVESFAEEIAGLGDKRGPILVQLPPKLAFDAEVAGSFLPMLRRVAGGQIVCEPRHPTWFDSDADTLLKDLEVARVAADPAPVSAAATPGGWPGLAYFRLHGSPRPYWSSYDEDALSRWAERVLATGVKTWLIFDNTASGAATADALALAEMLEKRPGGEDRVPGPGLTELT